MNRHVDSTTVSGNRTLLFGQFDKYLITEVSEIRIDNFFEVYADQDQAPFRAILRTDGQLIDAGQHPIAALVH